MPTTPNPGSAAAHAIGCTCPTFDNNHGRFAPMGDEWHVAINCPLHDPEVEP